MKEEQRENSMSHIKWEVKGLHRVSEGKVSVHKLKLGFLSAPGPCLSIVPPGMLWTAPSYSANVRLKNTAWEAVATGFKACGWV